MPFTRLTDLLERLATARHLMRIPQPVEAQGEIVAITQAVAAQRGPALQFDQVGGFKWPVVTNLLGSAERIALALGVQDQAELRQRIAAALAAPAESLAPRLGKQAPCQQVARLGTDVDLAMWPFPRVRSTDGGPAIYGGLVASSSPVSGQVAVELADLAIVGPRQLAGWWSPEHGVGLHLAQQRGRGPRLPVAICLGGDPAYALAAAGWVDRLEAWRWAGAVRGSAVELTAARTHALEVPADVEIVLEGYLDPDEPRRDVEPIGSPSGRAYARQPVPILHLTALTHRTQPLVPTMLTGPAPHERLVMQQFMAAARVELLRASAPQLVELALPAWGGFERLAVLSVDKQHPGDAWQLLHAAAAWPPLAEFTTLIAVDRDVRVADADNVWFAVGNEVDPASDVQNWPRRIPTRESGQPESSIGTRLAIDATRKLAGERATPLPSISTPSPETLAALPSRLRELGLEAFVR